MSGGRRTSIRSSPRQCDGWSVTSPGEPAWVFRCRKKRCTAIDISGPSYPLFTKGLHSRLLHVSDHLRVHLTHQRAFNSTRNARYETSLRAYSLYNSTSIPPECYSGFSMANDSLPRKRKADDDIDGTNDLLRQALGGASIRAAKQRGPPALPRYPLANDPAPPPKKRQKKDFDALRARFDARMASWGKEESSAKENHRPRPPPPPTARVETAAPHRGGFRRFVNADSTPSSRRHQQAGGGRKKPKVHRGKKDNERRQKREREEQGGVARTSAIQSSLVNDPETSSGGQRTELVSDRKDSNPPDQSAQTPLPQDDDVDSSDDGILEVVDTRKLREQREQRDSKLDIG